MHSLHGHLVIICGEQLPHQFHSTPKKTKGGEKGEKKIKTNGIVPFLSQMLFSHVLPQDQTLPLSVILPPFLL